MPSYIYTSKHCFSLPRQERLPASQHSSWSIHASAPGLVAVTTQNLYHHRICPCSPTCPVFFSSAEDLCQLFLSCWQIQSMESSEQARRGRGSQAVSLSLFLLPSDAPVMALSSPQLQVLPYIPAFHSSNSQRTCIEEP